MAQDLYGYDFSLFGPAEAGTSAPNLDPEHEGEVVPFRSPKKNTPKKNAKKKKTSSVTRAEKVATFQSFLRTSVVLAVVVFVCGLISTVIYLNARLDTTAKEISKVESEIEIAKSDNIRLNSYIQGLVSAEKLEQYAINNLGMIKMEDYRATYLPPDEDSQVVISGGKSYEDDSGSKLKKLLEYLFG